MAFNSKGFKKVYHISEPRPGPEWQFGRGKQRLGGLSVAETEERRITVAKDGAKRAVATRARRRCKALKVAGAQGGLE